MVYFVINIFTVYLKTLQYVEKNVFAHKNLKKTPSKVAQKISNPLFILPALSCPNGPNKIIDIPNLAYRPTL